MTDQMTQLRNKLGTMSHAIVTSTEDPEPRLVAYALFVIARSIELGIIHELGSSLLEYAKQQGITFTPEQN